jgi:hypothetical protein
MDSRSRRSRASVAPATAEDRSRTATAITDGERRAAGREGPAGAAASRARADALGRLDAQMRLLSRTLAAAEREDADRIVRLRLLVERLTERNREIQTLVGRVEQIRYHWMVQRVRRVIDRLTPRGATVAVVSHGDHQLTTVSGRSGWHLPQSGTATEPADDPADSHDAIAQVEQLRERGARYLVIPRTALWWLDRYQGLDDHLRHSATCLFHDVRTGALFALGAALTRS